jgi:hypothetical protein
MGANAVTTVYDFTAGQVLTAAQMDNVNCGIPVFATTTTRDAAFGGTGEKTLAEGQMAYIEATNTTQYYDGAAWQTLGSLSLITSGTSTASTELTLDGVFTASFRNYLLVADGTFANSDQGVNLRFRTSGSDNTTSNYSRSSIHNSAISGPTREYSTGQNTMQIGGSGDSAFQTRVMFYAPQIAARTFVQSETQGWGTTASYFYWNQGQFATTTQFDGFKIYAASGTTSLTYRLYGLANS